MTGDAIWNVCRILSYECLLFRGIGRAEWDALEAAGIAKVDGVTLS